MVYPSISFVFHRAVLCYTFGKTFFSKKFNIILLKVNHSNLVRRRRILRNSRQWAPPHHRCNRLGSGFSGWWRQRSYPPNRVCRTSLFADRTRTRRDSFCSAEHRWRTRRTPAGTVPEGRHLPACWNRNLQPNTIILVWVMCLPYFCSFSQYLYFFKFPNKYVSANNR